MTQNDSILKFAPLLSRRMAFLPAVDDDDELIKAINDDSDDDRWQLHDQIDPAELDEFWDNAREELRQEGQMSNTD
jgi:hypothetical protein